MNLGLPRRSISSTLVVALTLAGLLTPAVAQEADPFVTPTSFHLQKQDPFPPEATPDEEPQSQAPQKPNLTGTQPRSRYTEKEFLKDLLRDEKNLWTGPLRIGRNDIKWLVPFTASTAALVSTDRRVFEELPPSGNLVGTSRRNSHLGESFVLFG